MNAILRDDICRIIGDENIDWKELSASNIMITGATGLIGSLIVRALTEKFGDGKIIAVVRDQDKAKSIFGENDRIEYVISDIREGVHYSGSVDYIIHCASVTTSKTMVEKPVETLFTSILGTENVMKLAMKKEVRGVIYLSSMEVYGTTDESNNPITEEKLGYVDLKKPRSSYPEGKRVCELICNAYCHEYNVPVKTVRLAQTFGAGVPLSDTRVFMQFAKSVLKNEDIILHTYGKSLSNFCYTSDAIRAILMLLTKGINGEAYNVCHDEETRSIADIAKMVSELGENCSVVFDVPEQSSYGYAPDSIMHLNSDKLRSFGWMPQVSMKQAYVNLMKYIRAAS